MPGIYRSVEEKEALDKRGVWPRLRLLPGQKQRRLAQRMQGMRRYVVSYDRQSAVDEPNQGVRRDYGNQEQGLQQKAAFCLGRSVWSLRGWILDDFSIFLLKEDLPGCAEVAASFSR